jgi:hypothetical protein
MSEKLECRLDGFDVAEKARYASLRLALRAGTKDVRELEDGYAVRLDTDSTLFREAAEWITLERRCCPFLTLGLDWAVDDTVSLRLTGGPDVKTFLATALASPA